MKTSSIKLIALVLFGFMFFSCATEDDGIYFNEVKDTNVLNTKVSYSSMESDILDLVNAHRVSLNLSKLNALSIISNVANGHTNYMIEVGQANHDNFAERANNLKNNADAKSVGENVAYGFGTAQGVMNGWLNSADHKKIIENQTEKILIQTEHN